MSRVARAIGVALGAAAAAFFAPAVLTGFALTAFRQIAVGVALSAIGRALQPRQKRDTTRGTTLQVRLGEDQPQTFILGVSATAGDLAYVGSWGREDKNPNAYLVQVIELADWPAKLRRVWVNGEWATLASVDSVIEGQNVGRAVLEYREGSQDHLWIKFYDGTQTAADPYLIARFGSHSQRPWTSAMIGRGLPHSIVTARSNPEVHRGAPQCRFELEDFGRYDRRQDSTAGGSGPQRWSNRATWQPTDNNAVMVESILRGVHDPVTNQFVWGGQGITNRDLPLAEWFAAANECDLGISLEGGGTEPQYRAGMEVELDREPADVIEDLLLACQGQIAEAAGRWTMRAGPPGVPIYAFTDADLVITEPDVFEPFRGLEATHNGVAAQYPEPEDGWAAKDAPLRHSSTYQAEDGGRRQIADLRFDAVPYRLQVQRLMHSALEDNRRQRRHTLVMPPEVRRLGPLDTVAWTSERNGYSAKEFTVDLVEDLANGNAALALREIDPSDYDWSSDFELPTEVGFGGRSPRLPISTIAFFVETSIVVGSDGRQRPAIGLGWDPDADAAGVQYRVRLAADHTHIPATASVDASSVQTVQGFLMVAGEPVLLAGEPIPFGVTFDITAGYVRISQGILPLTDYEVDPRYLRDEGPDPWPEMWLPVTTLDIRLTETDFADDLNQRIDDMEQDAQDARQEALAAQTKAQEIEDLVAGLDQEVRDELTALVEALGGIESGDIQAILALAIAGHKAGWAADPTFQKWEGSNLEQWVTVGVSSFGEKGSGHYLGGLVVDVPTGSDVVSVGASSLNHLTAADHEAEYVVVTIMLRAFSGSLAGGRLRAEWRNAGTSTWVRGHAFGVNNSFGTLVQNWGFVVNPNRAQARAVVFRKPAGSHDAVQLFMAIKMASPTDAVNLRIDMLDIRAATDAEIAAYNSSAYTDAQITSLETTILGPQGALAATQDTVTAYTDAAVAQVQDSVVAFVDDLGALSGRVLTVEATHNDGNLVKNPDFRDGPRPAGQAPNWWGNWPAGFSVIERGSTGASAVQNAPSRYIAAVENDGLQHQARAFFDAQVVQGDRIAVRYHAAGGGTGINFQIQARMQWRNAANDADAAPQSVRAHTVTGTGWQLVEPTEFVAPEGAAFARLHIRRVAGGNGTGYFTSVEARKAEAATRALVSQVATAASTNEQAIASIHTTVNAEFGSLASFVSQSATAVASADLAASTFVLRAVAGAGEAGLRLVAFDDETGSGGIVRISGDSILLEGSVAMPQLVVTDLSGNLVPNGSFIHGDLRGWSSVPGAFTVVARGSSAANAVQTAPTPYILAMAASGSDQTATIVGSTPLKAENPLSVRFDYAGSGGSPDFTPRVILRYRSAAGALIGSSFIGPNNVSATGWQTWESEPSAPPAGTAYLEAEVRRIGGGSGIGYMTGIEIHKRHGAATLITPESIFTPLLGTNAVDARVANFVSLAAEEGWIQRLTLGELIVNDEKIDFNAVSTAPASFTAGEISFGAFTVLQSLTLTKARAEPIMIHVDFEVQRILNSAVEWRLRRGTTTFYETVEPEFVTGGGTWQRFIRTIVDRHSGTGSLTYNLEARRDLTGGTLTARSRTLIAPANMKR